MLPETPQRLNMIQVHLTLVVFTLDIFLNFSMFFINHKKTIFV